MRNEWKEVTEQQAEFLQSVGAKVEKRFMAYVPENWTIPSVNVKPKGITNKTMPTADTWVRQDQSVRLNVGKHHYSSTSGAGQALALIKEYFGKGDMKMVKTRRQIELHLLERGGIKLDQASRFVTTLVSDGWLKKAGPEQMK